MTTAEQLREMEPGTIRAWIVEQFYKAGRTIAAIAAESEWDPAAVETVIRDDMKWLAEVEAIATQAPHALSSAFDAQVIETMHAADARPWARGFRCGYATAKGEDSLAVSHMGNAIVARSQGVTRETT